MIKYNINDNLLTNATSKANVEKILHELTEDTENGTAGEFIRGWNAALRAVKEKINHPRPCETAGNCPMDGVCKGLIDKPKPAVKV